MMVFFETPVSHYCLFIIFSHMSQFRGSEIIELQNFSLASVDDIASVHTRAYVLGLEKVAGYFPLSFSFLVIPFIDLIICEKRNS